MAVNWIPQYEAYLPPRVQWDVDDCYVDALLTAMEMRGILMGQPVVQLSQLHLTYMYHAQTGPPPYDPTVGGTESSAAPIAWQTGVCREYLWPVTMIGNNDWQLTLKAVDTQPPGACYLDAGSHKLTTYSFFPSYQSQAEMIALIKQYIDAGYPVTAVDTLAYTHEYCIMGYDEVAGGCPVLDSHAWPQETFQPWSRLAPDLVIQGVTFVVPKQIPITTDQILSLQKLATSFPPANTLTMSTSTFTVDAAFVAQLQGLAGQFPSAAPPPPAVNLLSNGSFESPALAANSFSVHVTPEWGSVTISNGSNAYSVPQPYPDGVQCLVMQNASTAQQTFNVATAGTFTFECMAAYRTSWSSGSGPNQTVNVTIDGTQIGTINPFGTWQAFSFTNIALAAGSHTIKFAGTASGAGVDKTVFIDSVSLG